MRPGDIQGLRELAREAKTEVLKQEVKAIASELLLECQTRREAVEVLEVYFSL
jgi:hypothetical protein